MARYQFQTKPVESDDINPDGWRDLHANTFDEALQEVIDTCKFKASDLPINICLVFPGCPRHDNGRPMVVHSYTIDREENAK